MRLALVLVLLVGCKTDDGMFPIITGGSGGVIGGGHHDAGLIDSSQGDGGPTITGRACLISDVRVDSICATTGAGGFAVALGGKTAMTVDDGSFAIATPSGTNLEWQVSGSTIVTSAMGFAVSHIIPVIGDQTYLDLEGGNGVVPVQGEGAIIVRVVHGGAAVSGAVVSTSPVGEFAVYYDGSSATQWNQSATGINGVAWAPGIPVGAATTTVTPSGGSPQLVVGIPILDEGVTFVVVETP